MKKNRIYGLAILASFIAIWYVAHRTHKEEGIPYETIFERPFPKYGSMAPVFAATALDGDSVDLAELRGKPVLLLFFDSSNDADLSRVLLAGMLAIRNIPPAGILGISRSKENLEDLRLSFAGRIIFDGNLRLHKIYGFEDCCGGTVLIGPDQNVLFSVPYLAPGDLLRKILQSTFDQAAEEREKRT